MFNLMGLSLTYHGPIDSGFIMKDYGVYYQERCDLAAQDQGVTQLAAALNESGIIATVQQTGGFTMAAYVELSGDTYIYANPYGAAVYDVEGYGADIAQYDTAQDSAVIVKALEDYLLKNKGE